MWACQRILATGGWPSTSRGMWDIERQQAVGALEGHTSKIRGVAADPAGRVAVSFDEGDAVRVWSLASPLLCITTPACVPAVAKDYHLTAVCCLEDRFLTSTYSSGFGTWSRGPPS